MNHWEFMFFCSTHQNITSHFVFIHLSCHRKANYKDDEWEEAKLRNCERPCNAIFPIPIPTISRKIYLNLLNEFFSRNIHTNFFQSIYFDVHTNLKLISNGEKSQTSLMHTVNLIPLMIYAGHLILDSEASDLKNRKAYEGILERMIESCEEPTLNLVLSFWILSAEEFAKYKFRFYKKFFENRNIVFSELKPSLILVILIEEISSLLKTSVVFNSINDSTLTFSVSHHSGDEWISSYVDLVSDDWSLIYTQWTCFYERIETVFLPISSFEDAQTILGFDVHSFID